MYRYLSSEGRQWYKDIEYVRQVGRKVGHLDINKKFKNFIDDAYVQAVTESEKEMEGKEFGNTNDSKTGILYIQIEIEPHILMQNNMILKRLNIYLQQNGLF